MSSLTLYLFILIPGGEVMLFFKVGLQSCKRLSAVICSKCSKEGIDNKALLEPGKRHPAGEARAVAALLGS